MDVNVGCSCLNRRYGDLFKNVPLHLSHSCRWSLYILICETVQCAISCVFCLRDHLWCLEVCTLTKALKKFVISF